MAESEPPKISRDSNGRVTEVVSDRRISGPLGIWPWPILNMLADMSNSSRVEVTRVNRDEKGRIEEIEEMKL